MKIHAFILALSGIVGTAALVHAQNAPMPPDPLSDLQKDFGAIVGEAFHRPDPVVAAVSTPGSPAVAAGKALQTSMAIPGAVFAGALKPLADADAAEPPAPAAAPAPAPPPRHRRHARAHHHRAHAQG